MNHCLQKPKISVALKHVGRWMPFIVLLLGLLPRMSRFFLYRTLWIDEALHAHVITQSSYSELLQPFHPLLCIAPTGYWLAEKISTEILGENEFAFRLYPFLCGATSLFLFERLVKKHATPVGGIISLALFACSWGLIFYTGEVRPYAGDVLFGLLIAYLAMMLMEIRGHRFVYWALGITGCVLPWFSYTSVFVLAGAGITIGVFLLKKKETRPLIYVITIGVFWLASWAVNYLTQMRPIYAGDSYKKVMMYFSVDNNPSGNEFVAFPPFPPSSAQDMLWLPHMIVDFFDFPCGITFIRLAIIVAVIGCTVCLRRKPYHFMLLILPWLFVIMACYLHFYPLRHRYIVFLAPSAFLFIGTGLGFLLEKPKLRLLGVPILILLLVHPLANAVRLTHSPTKYQDLDSLIQIINQNWETEDIIYVPFPTTLSFQYCAPRHGIDPARCVLQPYYPEYPTPQEKVELESRLFPWTSPRFCYEEQFKQLKGHGRVWVPMQYWGAPEGFEPDYVTQSYHTHDAVLTLYDLSSL